MAQREVITLTPGTPQLEAPQSGDHYYMPRDLEVAGNITITGTVDGRDVAADGVRLDTMEDNAKDDQTGPEIEALANHDNLLGYVAAEHIDWSVTGAEDVHVDRIPSHSHSLTEADIDLSTTNRIVGRVTAGAGAAEELTAAQVRTLINVEDGSEVTSAAKVISALDGASISTATVATGDKVLIQDVNDSDNLKTVTAESIAALADGDDATGKQTMWIPAAGMYPPRSNGASWGQVETTAGRPDIYTLDFDDSADEHAQFAVAFPKQWDIGTVTFKFYWTMPTASTNGVAFALQAASFSNDTDIDAAYGTAVVVQDDGTGWADSVLISPESSAVTVAYTPADEDLCYFQLFRDVSDSNDDYANDARLIGIKLYWTNDVATDD